MMARQSFHALRSPSALALSSKRSATSRIKVPRAEADVSEKREKKASTRLAAETLPWR